MDLLMNETIELIVFSKFGGIVFGGMSLGRVVVKRKIIRFGLRKLKQPFPFVSENSSTFEMYEYK